MLINAVFVFFSVLGCALTSRANQLPLRSGATGATLSLWEGFDLTLPSQDSIDDFFAQAGDGISQAVDIGKQKVDGLRKSPVSTAATEIFDNAVKTSKEKLQDLGKSGVVADAGNWAVDATSNVAVLVDGAMTDFQASQLGFEALKLAAYVKEFGEDRVRDLKGVEVPESVLVWFAEARRDLDIAVTEFKEQEVPKAVLKWIEEHPTEMETAGWVLKNGVWLALTANPAMAWSPLLHVLGWGSKGPILGSFAARWQSGMKLVSPWSAFAFLQSAAMGGRAAGVMNGVVRSGVASPWVVEEANKFAEKVAKKTEEKKKEKTV